MKECQVVQQNNKPESEIWKNADLLAEPSEKKFMNLEAESRNSPEPEWSSIWKIMLKIVTSPRCSLIIRRKVGSSGPSNNKIGKQYLLRIISHQRKKMKTSQKKL